MRHTIKTITALCSLSCSLLTLGCGGLEPSPLAQTDQAQGTSGQAAIQMRCGLSELVTASDSNASNYYGSIGEHEDPCLEVAQHVQIMHSKRLRLAKLDCAMIGGTLRSLAPTHRPAPNRCVERSGTHYHGEHQWLYCDCNVVDVQGTPHRPFWEFGGCVQKGQQATAAALVDMFNPFSLPQSSMYTFDQAAMMSSLEDTMEQWKKASEKSCARRGGTATWTMRYVAAKGQPHVDAQGELLYSVGAEGTCICNPTKGLKKAGAAPLPLPR